MAIGAIISAAIAATATLTAGVMSSAEAKSAEEEAKRLAGRSRADALASERISRYLREREIRAGQAIGEATLREQVKQRERAIGAGKEEQAYQRWSTAINSLEDLLNQDQMIKNTMMSIFPDRS